MFRKQKWYDNKHWRVYHLKKVSTWLQMYNIGQNLKKIYVCVWRKWKQCNRFLKFSDLYCEKFALFICSFISCTEKENLNIKSLSVSYAAQNMKKKLKVRDCQKGSSYDRALDTNYRALLIYTIIFGFSSGYRINF